MAFNINIGIPQIKIVFDKLKLNYSKREGQKDGIIANYFVISTNNTVGYNSKQRLLFTLTCFIICFYAYVDLVLLLVKQFVISISKKFHLNKMYLLY